MNFPLPVVDFALLTPRASAVVRQRKSNQTALCAFLERCVALVLLTVLNSCSGSSSPGPATYVISVSAAPTAGGSVSGGGSFAANAPVTITATPSAGYTFSDWTENGVVVSSTPTYTFTAAASRTLVATFEQIFTVSLSANPVAAGSVTGGGTYAPNSSVTISATPASGYMFSNWTENGAVVTTLSSYALFVIGNRTLVANFEIAASTAWLGTYSGTGSWSAGDGFGGPAFQDIPVTVEITASPVGPQYIFVRLCFQSSNPRITSTAWTSGPGCVFPVPPTEASWFAGAQSVSSSYSGSFNRTATLSMTLSATGITGSASAQGLAGGNSNSTSFTVMKQ